MKQDIYIKGHSIGTVPSTHGLESKALGDKGSDPLELFIPSRLDPNFQPKSFRKIFLVGLVVLLIAIFTLDLITPSGVAIGMLYVGAVFLSGVLPFPHASYLIAGLSTLLTVIGMLFSPGVSVVYSGSTLAWTAMINRLLSIFTIWTTAYLVSQFRKGVMAKLEIGAIVESSHDAIIGQTLQGVVTSWNKGAKEVFGYTAEEAIGKPLLFLFPPGREAEEEQILAKLQKGERIVNFETIRRRKDGRHIHVSLTISPLITRWGKLIGASKIARDITFKKQMEREMERQHKKLQQHATALKESNEDLEQFAYIASHDLQEPLRTIHGFTQLLADRNQGQLDAQSKEFMDFVTEAAERMQSLIQDLLKFSRVQAKKIVPISLNTEEILQELLSQLSLTLEETHASITHDPLPNVEFDPGHFRHLLQNLLTNSLKYKNPDPPVIHIGVLELSKEWQFSIQDNGIGIAPEYFEKIFQAFKRLHTKQEYPGTGIGLALCKKIVERGGGRIWVESEVGKGSKFSFTIPKVSSIKNFADTGDLP